MYRVNKTNEDVDYKTGDPVQGAKVSFIYEEGGQIEAITDEKGEYSLKPENDKVGRIVITCDSWVTRNEGNTSRGSDSFEVWNYDIKKVKDTYTLTGKIFNSKDKSVLAGAEVDYVYEDGTKISTKTDNDGNFTLYPELKKEGELHAKHDKFKIRKQDINQYTDSRTRQVVDMYLDEEPEK